MDNMKKSIEIIIREMIQKVEELGHKPIQIKLSEEHYKELVGIFSKAKYVRIDTGFYYEYRPPEDIQEYMGIQYMGIPVKKSYETVILWAKPKGHFDASKITHPELP